MSTPADYLTFLRQKGVKLWIADGELHYHARKGILGAEELARLREMKRKIIAELSKPPGSAIDAPMQQGVEAGRQVPLSFQQQWLLTMTQEHSHWKATLSYALKLTGEVDTTALEKSFQAVFHRHEVLRTKIVRVDGALRQEVEELPEFHLTVTGVRGGSDVEIESNTLALIREIEARALDPAVAPMMAAELLHVSPRNHFLVLVIHRLAADCLGVGQVLRSLWVLYGEALRGHFSRFEDESGQYRDYAIWQHATNTAWQGKHAAYWNERLAGAERIHWPVEVRATTAASDSHAHLASTESSLGETLSARLRELARQRQTLPALVMLAVYAASISKLCQQQDFILPFLIAGRDSERESVVGYFSYIVYLRVKCGGSESFIDLLKQVSNEYYRAAAFRQDFARNVAQRPELLGGTLCQWLSWHPTEVAGLGQDDLTRDLELKFQRIRCQNLEELTNVPPAAVDIEIAFFDVAGDIGAFATYRSDRFAKGSVLRLMQQLRSTAEHVVTDPLCPIAD